MVTKTGMAVLAALLTSAAATPASATLLTYTLTGPFVAVWTIDSNRLPDAVGTGSFVLNDVPGNYSAIPANGGTAINYLADVTFYTSEFQGGISLNNFYTTTSLLDATGEQLFVGSTAVPVYRTGTFVLTGIDNNAGQTFTLTVAAAAVPEPASWAMMIGGFGLVGGAMRRRTKQTVSFA